MSPIEICRSKRLVLLLCPRGRCILDLPCLSGVPAAGMALDFGGVFCGKLGNHIGLWDWVGIFLPSDRKSLSQTQGGMRHSEFLNGMVWELGEGMG